MKKRTKLLRKILSVALAASVIASVTATVPLSVSAWAVIEDDFGNITDHEIYVQGNFGNDTIDIPLSDADNDGIYLGVVENISAGEYSYLVHLDSSFDYYWGGQDEDERYLNTGWYSGVKVENNSNVLNSNVLIIFDTTKSDDPNYWSVSAVPLVSDTHDPTYNTSAHTFGVIGSFNSWADDAEMMNLGGGIYAANIGDFIDDASELKVRADGKWSDNWGAYEADYGRTYNSQTTIMSPDNAKNVIVVFDTNTMDYNDWPIYIVYTNAEDGQTYYRYFGEDTDSGNHIVLGDHITWEVSDNALIISGYGSMNDFTQSPFIRYADKVYKKYGCKIDDIEEIIINPGVNTIGDYAFAGMSGVKTVIIPEYDMAAAGEVDGLESIGYNAFRYCSGLKNIELPNSIASIGEYAFANCASLESIKLPDGLETIPYAMLNGCSSLKSINIPERVQYLGAYAFNRCTSLTSVTIPAEVKSLISRGCFQGCTSLAEVNILSNNIETIDVGAFSECTSLKKINIPNSVAMIGDGAFQKCHSLESITIPEGVTTIGGSAFYDCPKLKVMDILQIGDIYIGELALGMYWNESAEDTMPVPDFTIRGYKDSYIESYAVDNYIKFVDINAEPLKNTSTISAKNITLGEKVTVTAAGTGGTGPYTYEVTYKKSTDTKWTTKQAYGENASINIKPGAAATYTVKVRVKDSTGTVSAKNLTVNVYNELENDSSVSANAIVLGDKVTVKAAAKGGSGKYTYEVTYKKSTDTKWATKQAYSTNASVNIKPGAAADYIIKVRVKDSVTGKVVGKNLTVKVNAEEPLTNTSTISSTSIKLGEKVTVNAAGAGGTGPYTYEVTYKKSTDTKWATKQAYSENASVSVKPAAATKYTVKVRVKDSKGTVVGKNFTVNVTAPLTNTSTISSTSIKLGEKVTVTAAGAGGTGPYTYEVTYKKSTDTKWATKQAYGTNTGINIKPGAAATYTVKVRIKDSEGTIVGKNFTVKVS